MYYVILLRGFIYLKAFSIDVNLGEFVLLHAFGYALSSIGLTPGNIGVTELSWFGVLMLMDTGYENAAMFAVGQRLINTGTILALTAASYVFYSVFRRKGSPLGSRLTEAGSEGSRDG